MARKPKPAPPAPDGAPKTPPVDNDSSNRSTVSEAQDPLISGDAGRPKYRNSDEAGVDDAGQTIKDKAVDLLH